MGKDLSRRPGATDNADAMAQILEGAELALVSLSSIAISPDFNPRTRHMKAEQRERLFDREALANLISSMSEVVQGRPRGVLQPLLVRPAAAGYQLVAGERRFHAAKHAGLRKVPVLIKEMDDEQARAAAIIENSQRRGLDPISETREGFAFLEHLTGLDVEQVMALLDNIRKGRTPDDLHLDERLRVLYDEGVATWSQTRAAVLRLNAAEQQAVLDGHLNYRHAARLTSLKQPEVRAAVLRDILNSGQQPSLRELQTLIDRYLGPQQKLQSRAAILRSLASRVGRLKGEKATEADRLIEQLQLLTDLD